MIRKRRSTFWVVTTHVLTAGMGIPFLAALVGIGINRFLPIRDPVWALCVQLACTLVGYIGGPLYSLSYLKSAATHDRWTDCTLPSIIGFVVLTSLGCTVQLIAWNANENADKRAVVIGIMAVSYVIDIIIFSWLTATGFKQMAASAPEPEVQTPVATRIRSLITSRLLGGVIGLAAGFVMGAGVIMFSDGGGWTPPAGWQTRLITGVVTGGVGALLGLISGPPRL